MAVFKSNTQYFHLESHFSYDNTMYGFNCNKIKMWKAGGQIASFLH